ncbi:MAG: ROK family protein [Erysipelotrichaceae bacterium]|nr:ROK family protein [Erysipelotrichaceae bacterium]
MKLLTFDVGGTEIKYAVSDENMNFTNKGYVPTPMDTFEHFADVISEIYEQFKDEVEGIAMCLPGFIDVENGRCNGGGGLLYNHGTDVARLLQERCNCKIVLENDAKAAIQAEYYRGSLKGCKNAAVFIIGTGVGGALVIDSKIVRGPHFTAGEFSFVITDASKYDQGDVTMANSCSTRSMLQSYAEKTGSEEVISGREFFNRLSEDPLAQEALDELCTNIAVQIYNLSWILDLEKIAIGGGISSQPVVREKIREKFETVKENSAAGKYHYKMYTEIVPCTYNNDANLIGAFITYTMN